MPKLIDRDIQVRGAREHNLQSVNVTLPRGAMICFSGVSGSGKSSLAFDTLYAEGQRRYLESLSSYARQFIGQLPKPDVDYLSGLSPAISISQKSTGNNPRSTVGTITEISDFLRVIYARVGTAFCPTCDEAIVSQTRDQIVAKIQSLKDSDSYVILAPIIRNQKGEHRDLFEELRKQGFNRARVDGQIVSLAEPPDLDRQLRHHIELVVDRIQMDKVNRQRLSEAVDTAARFGEGTILVQPMLDPESRELGDAPAKKSRRKMQTLDSKSNAEDPHSISLSKDIVFSTDYSCPRCGNSYPPPTPQLLSFNSPQGMCLQCDGLGQLYTFDPELLIADSRRSIHQGAIALYGKWSQMSRWLRQQLQGVAATLEKEFSLKTGYLLKTAWRDLEPKYQTSWLYGTGDRHITYVWRAGSKPVKFGGTYVGMVPQLLTQWNNLKNPMQRKQYEKYMHTLGCGSCKGERLNPQARNVRLKSLSPKFSSQPWRSLPELSSMPLGESFEFLNTIELSSLQHQIADEALKETRSRIGFLLEVGLSYLSLSRTAPTLSGGESQRIRLASQIGSGLVGVLYVLDEPSIGLHPRDNAQLLNSLKRLRDLGNTLIVVEHDEDTMREADLVVDFGPGPGVRGGHVTHSGTVDQLVKSKVSLTGAYLSGRMRMETPLKRREGNGKSICVRGATHNNLKNIDVEFPLGRFISVTGVSGSGKSSIVTDILTPVLRVALNGAEDEPGNHRSVEGIEYLDKIIDIDQSPIGRTPRSNPATYVKVFDEIRDLFAQLPESKKRGFQPGRFSFNTQLGRCAACEGNGSNRLDMEFLADIWIPCPVCEGKRYDRETLQVTFKDKSIADCLDLDVQLALELFSNLPKIAEKLQTLHDVGLDYLKLGQPSPTLSGGEAQRIKLAKELSRRSTGKTLYVLDEPTTGLHFADIALLLKVLHRLVDLGNTVIVVEHNLDLIQASDWVIDLGPEGGAGGGEIVAQGTPEQLSKIPSSYTGQALANYFLSRKRNAPKRAKATSRKSAKHQELRNLVVQGATQHNLKGINVSIPRNAMTVFCGPSGSGKTSLAMDTIYAEGQRRFVESLSSYARQFVGQMPKPTIDLIEGLSPAVAIEQKNLGHTPRSTVGTVTEIYDYMRLLMARLGQMHCPQCDRPVATQTIDQITDQILSLPTGTLALLLARIPLEKGASYEDLFANLQSQGYVRFRIDGVVYNFNDIPQLARTSHHEVQVVVDRLKIPKSNAVSLDQSRVADSVSTALGLGKGVIELAIADSNVPENHWKSIGFSLFLACNACGLSFPALTPHSFSFNTQLGWCPSCEGLGTQMGTNPAALMDPTRSLSEGGLLLWPDVTMEGGALAKQMLEGLCHHASIPGDVPLGKLSSQQRQILLFGTGNQWISPTKTNSDGASMRFKYRGIYPTLEMISRSSPSLRIRLEQFVAEVECIACLGARIRPEAAHSRIQGLTLGSLVGLPLGQLLDTVRHWKFTKREQAVAGELLREIESRLQFLVDVGLEYLSLGRGANTLSGGEAQRIRLASQLGSGLCGVLYVLDEPTIGLHPRDNQRLISTMQRLRDLGNTMIVVEHDRDVIASSDMLCDFGPGSGTLGGELVASGTPSQCAKQPRSVTGPFLNGKKAIPIPTSRRLANELSPASSKTSTTRQAKKSKAMVAEEISTYSSSALGNHPTLWIRGARHNTLKNLDVAIPLGALIAVTGPSGSGKSSLIHDILYPALARRLHRAQTKVGAHRSIDGVSQIDKVVSVDQSPLGASPSSNPATYTGVFELIRQLYAQLPDAKVRGFTARQFSFNVAGGRCEKCEGNGQIRIEMHFLPDVWVQCDACRGRRYTEETLSVKFHGHSIHDLLEMPIGRALQLMENLPKIRRILQTLADVGLDYLRLGQSAPTLSGGEAQRVKLATELSRPDTGKTLYLLDEPTTGLHFEDIAKLLLVMHRLVDLGNTVLVVEHNLDVIKSCDWIIDMGPEAGWDGGQVVVSGTPEKIVAHAQMASANQRSGERSKKKSVAPVLHRSYTGEALASILAAGPYESRTVYDPKKDLAPRAGDLSIAQVGKHSQAPWEQNGRGWHLETSVDRKGEAPKWERRLLKEVIQRIESTKGFGPIDWNSRSIVSAEGLHKSNGWFLHAITAETWLLKLKFRIPRGLWTKPQILDMLTLPTLNQLEGVQAYSNQDRVFVSTGKDWQEVEIRPHRFEEIDSPTFWKWLNESMKAFVSLPASQS